MGEYLVDACHRPVDRLKNELHSQEGTRFIQQVNSFERADESSDWLSDRKGRPAWYDKTGEIKEAFVIGVCGGSASGKTTVAQRIVEKLNVPWVTLLSMDSFYKVELTWKGKLVVYSNDLYSRT